MYKIGSYTSYQILRSFKTKNIHTIRQLFITYVRPKLEYNSTVWSPYLKRDISKIESVQRTYTRLACLRCNIPFSGYQDRLKVFGIKSLHHRRLIIDLVLVFKIIKGFSDLRFNDFFEFVSSPYALRGNSLKIRSRTSILNTKITNEFFQRVVKMWNSLPNEIASATTTSQFKTKLDKHDLSAYLSWCLPLLETFSSSDS